MKPAPAYGNGIKRSRPVSLPIVSVSNNANTMSYPNVFSTPRAAIMLVFASFGAVVGTFSGAIPQIVRQTGTDSQTLGLALTLLTIANISTMAFGGALARRFSHRFVLLMSLPAFVDHSAPHPDRNVRGHALRLSLRARPSHRHH